MTARARTLPLLLFLLLIGAVGVWAAGSSNAQAQDVTANIATFQTNNPGLEYEVLADITAGGTATLYSRGRFGVSGNATSDSDLDLPGDGPIILIRTNNSGSELQLNDDGDLHLGDFFGVGGEGRDLSFYLMLTRDTSVTHSFTVEDTYNRAGGGYLNLHNLPTAAAAAWGGIESGEHFVFAIARDPGVNAHPEFPASFYVRAVDENVLIGTNVGSAITATDPDNDTLSYALSGTGAGDFNVSSAGQITAAVATLDHETTNSYSLTLTASDGNGGEASATVIITINDLDERPSLTPDPSGQTWHRNTNQQFTVANTPGIIAVRITETVDTGNLTLHTTESDLSCSNQTDEFTVNTASTIWIRFCQNGTVSLRAEDRDDSTNFRDYTVTIAATNNAPEFAEATYSRAVNENVSSGSNVGTAVTAEDGDGDTLSYSLSGTGSANFAVNRGQITTVSGFSPNFEDTESYSLTLTADDGNGGSDTATVNITINNVDDAPAIDPSPTTTAMATGRNYRFRVSARLGVQNVIVRDAPGNISGDITLRSTEAGLSCDNQSNELQLASVAEFWVRACAHGTATISIEEQDSAVDIRRYTVTIAEAVTVPDAPTNLQGSPGDASVVLTWQEPADGGSEILRYEYTTYETPANASYWRSTGGTSLTYTVTQTSDQANPTNLVNGTSYPFFVRAVNVEGAGPRSNRVAVTPTPPTVPDAPTNLAATPGNGQVELTWDAPDDGGSNITRYEYSTDNGTTWTSTGGTATSYTATQTSGSPTASLSNGTEYTFRVRAVNGVGDSGPSGSQTATPLGPPGAPGNLQVSAGDQEVRLTWNAAAANGANITRYEYSSDNGSSWRTTGSTSRSYTATTISGSGGTTLQNGTEYTFRVRAVNSEGNGPQSNSQTATPTTNTVPGQVIGLVASPGDGFLDLSWDEPSDGGSTILRYEYQTTNNPWESIGSTNTTFRATRRSGNGNDFVNGVFYGVRIRAVNATGDGAQSAGGGGVPNNQPPAFSAATASRSVNENELSGTDVGSPVTATDPENNSISYSITGSNPGNFNIDSSSGQIETGQLLNHESTDSYTITVRASATGGSDTVTVNITVDNVNEAPSFSSASVNRSVPENSPANTDVGAAVGATDPDSGDSLTYTLYNGQGRFTIVSGTGQLRVASGADLDHETTASYSVTVRATDGGGLYDETALTINIANVVEDATLSSLSVPSADVTRTTARAVATLDNPDDQTPTVYFRHRTPPGSGPWNTAASETASGTSASHNITGLTAGSQYRVQASLDSGFATTVESNFTAVANAAPAFPSSTTTREIDENRPEGTKVGDLVTATDADGDTLTYSLSGTNAGDFAIDSATGQITVGLGTVLDYETTSSYSVTVTATDTHTATGSTVVTVEVNDLREAGVLGRIVISVGRSGMNYGYDRGSYGTRDSGEWPGDLFLNGQARTIDEIYEDGNGDWYFTYTGGLADDWITDEDALREILVTVAYDDDKDTRQFVLGGFIDSRPGTRGLKLSPPLPSRDWDSHHGQEVAIEFTRPRSQTSPPVPPPAQMEPVAVQGSLVAFLLDTTPGGGVVFQSLLTIFVFSAYLFSVFKRSTRPQAFEVLLAGIVLCLTPWVPVIWGIGDLIAGVIIGANVANGAFVYKAFFARTEG